MARFARRRARWSEQRTIVDGSPGGQTARYGTPWSRSDDFPNRRGEAIPSPRHRIDERLSVRQVAERLAQRVDMLCEIGVIDERVRPERVHQLRLGHHTIGIAREEKQQVERLGAWNRVAPRSSRLGDVYPERPES